MDSPQSVFDRFDRPVTEHNLSDGQFLNYTEFLNGEELPEWMQRGIGLMEGAIEVIEARTYDPDALEIVRIASLLSHAFDLKPRL